MPSRRKHTAEPDADTEATREQAEEAHLASHRRDETDTLGIIEGRNRRVI